MMYLYQFFRYLRDLKEDESGQGTTEYAILVGVLVVIAIVAIIAFKGKVSELWEAITSGSHLIESLFTSISTKFPSHMSI